jgi:hypothetical protein
MHDFGHLGQGFICQHSKGGVSWVGHTFHSFQAMAVPHDGKRVWSLVNILSHNKFPVKVV